MTDTTSLYSRIPNEDHKSRVVATRITESEYRHVEIICRELQVTKAELIWRGIKLVSESLGKK